MNNEIKFLIVDDFEMLRSVIRTELNAMGFTKTLEAPNGVKALALLEASHNSKEPVNVIFCDWNMPEMNGVELLAKMKADARFKSIPFIMVTAEGEMKSVISAVEAGVTEYIVKPIAKDLLRKKILRVLDKLPK